MPDTQFLPADSTDRRGKLLIAAYELLGEEGLEGLTIRAVLARTGLARRAFYDCFAGKDELVLAVFKETLEMAARHYGGLCRDIAAPVERVRFIVQAIVQGQGYLGEVPDRPRDRRGAALSREHMRLAESHPAELQAALRPLLAMISGQLADGMADGSVRQADPDLLASLVYNLVSTTVHTEFIAAADGSLDPVRRKALAEDIWEFCRRAIAV